nr:MAG TPA: hypothetical protein [Caudoviricetes sp.]
MDAITLERVSSEVLHLPHFCGRICCNWLWI